MTERGAKLWGVLGTVCMVASVGFLLYVTLAWMVPIGFIRTLTSFPEVLWNRLPHAVGLSRATKDVPAAIQRTEAMQTALREQAVAANAALAQAVAARGQVAAMKEQLAKSQAALRTLLGEQAALEASNVRHAARIAELEQAMAVVRARPLPTITTRQEALDALRRAGY